MRAHYLLVFTSNRANWLRKILVWFCWLFSVHFSLVVLFVFQKFFRQFHMHLASSSLLRFCFQDFPHNPEPKYHGQQIFSHSCKLKRKLTSTLARDLKSESLNENHLVTAHTSQNLIRGTWLDVSFSSHVKKVIRIIWLAFSYLDQLVNENLFHAFSVGKSQYVYNNIEY